MFTSTRLPAVIARRIPGEVDAGGPQFAPEAGPEGGIQFLEAEPEGVPGIRARGERQQVSEVEEILVEEVLVEDRLTALLGHQAGPRAPGGGISRVERDLAAQVPARDAPREDAEFGVGVGEVGEARPAEERGALPKQVIHFHNEEQVLRWMPPGEGVAGRDRGGPRGSPGGGGS